MLQGITVDDQKALLLSVGTHRGHRPASPLEVAAILRKALDAGATAEDLAETCHLRGTTMISRFLRLLNLPDDIHDWIDWQSSAGQLSMTAGQEIGRLGSDHEMRDLARLALESRLTGKEVGQVVMRTRRAGETVTDAVSAVVRLRPRIERVFVFVGSVAKKQVQVRLAEMSKAERTSLLSRTIEIAGIDGLSGSLSPERFTLIANGQMSSRHTANELEALVNPALEKALADE